MQNPSERHSAATAISRIAFAANRFGGAFAAVVLVMAARRIASPMGLVLMFVLWVVAPYVLLEILALRSRASKQPTRLVLHAEMPCGAVLTAAVYLWFGVIAARPVVALFVVGPPILLLSVALSVAFAALVGSRSTSKRRLHPASAARCG